MRAGFAWVDVTPPPGLALMGQFHERLATHARDPLCANAVAFQAGDAPAAVIVSCDVALLETPWVDSVRQRFAEQSGQSAEQLIVHATHTHVGPCTTGFFTGEPDAGWLETLAAGIVEAATQALARLTPVTLQTTSCQLANLGWNRRGMYADGTSSMYGHSDAPGFLGLEGPRDPEVGLIAARDGGGRVVGVVLSFATHPNSLEGEQYYSADLPGEVRRVLRGAYGPEAGVVYLTGAAGNTAPSILHPHDPSQPWRGEAGVRRSGEYLGGMVLAALAEPYQPAPDELAHHRLTIDVPLRHWPTPDEPHYPIPLDHADWGEACDYYRAEGEAWPTRENPVPVHLNCVRVGDALIATCPAELFVEWGLALRATRPGAVTLIAELTDGYVGYVPTSLAFGRGGYETWPAYSSRLIEDAGQRIVDGWLELTA